MTNYELIRRFRLPELCKVIKFEQECELEPVSHKTIDEYKVLWTIYQNIRVHSNPSQCELDAIGERFRQEIRYFILKPLIDTFRALVMMAIDAEYDPDKYKELIMRMESFHDQLVRLG